MKSAESRIRGVAAALVLLAGCGGSGGEKQASPAGLWGGIIPYADSGGDPNEPREAFMLITPEGDFSMAWRLDGLQLTGSLSVSGNQATGSWEAALPLQRSFTDGSNTRIGTLELEINEGEYLLGHYTYFIEGTGGTPVEVTGHFILDYLVENQATILEINLGDLGDDYFKLPAYSDLTAGNLLTSMLFDGDMGWVSSNSQTGCVLQGSIDLPDLRWNIYLVEMIYSNCSSDRSVLNGVPFSGYMHLVPYPDSSPIVIFQTTGRIAGIPVSLHWVALAF